MAKPPPPYGLEMLKRGSPRHAVVVLHGIRQTRDDLKPLARRIAAELAGLSIYLYGYDHTLGLEENGEILFSNIESELPGPGRIDLVGYSMGGLIARLAASERARSNIHTVVTLATPNRGSLSNSELTMLGQLGRKAFEIVSPLLPRTEGVKDLTRVQKIMRKRRRRLLAADRAFQFDGDERRYVSIPALWYSTDKADFELGPSVGMTGVVAAFKVAALKLKLEAMQKSHDGIVTESSNNLATRNGNDWAEFHLVTPGPSQAPPLCHAVIEVCDQHDHMTIIDDEHVARLICSLLDTLDWSRIKIQHPELVHARFHPFAT